MFEEKKNANAYNYSQEFPPTLRDLVSRYTTLRYLLNTTAQAKGITLQHTSVQYCTHNTLQSTIAHSTV